MPEELRIVVVDQGGAAGGRGAPGGGGQFPRAPGGGQFPGGPVAPPVQPPPFVRPPPVQPSPKAPATKDPFRGAISAVGTAGGVAGAAAAGNVAGAASRGAAGIVAAVGGPIGLAVAAVAAGLGVAAIAALKFAQVIESQTNKLARFSGPLSVAQTQSEINRELSLIRRAQRIGPELAAAERLRSKFEDALTDLGSEILAALLKILEALKPFIEFVIVSLETTSSFFEKHQDLVVKALTDLLLFGPLLRGILEIAKWWRGEQDKEPDEDEDPFFREFMDLLPAVQNRQGGPLFFELPRAEPGV